MHLACCSNKCAECFFFLIKHLHNKIFMYLKSSIVYIHIYFLLMSVFLHEAKRKKNKVAIGHSPILKTHLGCMPLN